ncbi:unnamed protein product [Allacma fusca]|uniref:mRNA-decapping enzyme C-terminal domain-containing protein n=1 Tax=Allacma fusca TaxID=39272 RepID=A0A8J2PS03_9HEXA|nr:unnamed protein product [Allacma fusca]
MGSTSPFKTISVAGHCSAEFGNDWDLGLCTSSSLQRPGKYYATENFGDMSDRTSAGMNGRGSKGLQLVTGTSSTHSTRGRTGSQGSSRRHTSSVTLRGSKDRKSGREGESRKDEATRLNSEVVKRQDPCFSRIIRIASQVALYEYDCQAKKWESVGISGCLFLYERTHAPTNGLFILNRNSLNNFVQLLTPDIEVQVVMPHILMNNQQVIRCLWFYNESECIQIASDVTTALGTSVRRLERESSTDNDSDPTPSASQPNKPAPSTNLILDMLLNTHHNQAKESNATQSNTKASRPTTASQITNGLQQNWGFQEDQLPDRMGEEQEQGEEAGRNICAAWTGHSNESLAFPNLFSSKLEMPVFDFPEEPDRGDVGKPGLFPSNNLQSLGEELRATLGIQNRSDAVADWMKQGELGDQSEHFDVAANFQRQCVVNDPTWSIEESLQHLPSSEIATSVVEDGENEGRKEFERKKQEILGRERREAAFREFSHRKSLDMQSGGDSCLPSSHHFPQPTTRVGVLNKDQMIQALSYLLKTDADFAEKLHKAYLSCSKEGVRE